MKQAVDPPDSTQLRENVVHVAFELVRMERAKYLEEFLLHARLMREFLWRSGKDSGPGMENALLAEHYVGNPSVWRSTKGGLPTTLEATKDRIDRQVFHLSRDRASEFIDLEPEVPKIKDEIEAQWTRFEEALSDDWAPLFREALDRKRHELTQTPQ